MQKARSNWNKATLFCVVGCAMGFLTGCQHRAYSDLYTESMAGEIRELEDRIYEYDAAYQGIEEELVSLQSENAALHQKLMRMQSEPPIHSGSRSLFKGSSRDGQDMEVVKPEASFQVIPKPDPVPSMVPSMPSKSTNGKTPSADNLPTPAKPAPSTNTKPKVETQDLEAPSIDMGKPSASPTLPGIQPSPADKPALSTPPNSLLAPPSDAILPPPTTNNQPRAPIDRVVPASHTATQSLPKSLDSQTVDEGKIELPPAVKTATHLTSSRSFAASVQDNKVVEIAFHPTLCRGQYLGSNDKADGLYLVLQPRNGNGETIDIPASVTIVAVDPSRQEKDARLGRWTFTKEEVDSSLEPIGIGHGYHLRLDWQQIKPVADAVHVYVRYEMPDGRRLVNERRIQLHVPTVGSNSWTPRVAK